MYSFMVRMLGDLRYFIREVIEFGLWRYDGIVYFFVWRGEMEKGFE